MQVAFEKEAKLKAVRPPWQKFWPKILTPYFLYSNLYLHFLRPFCENIFKFVCIVSEQLGNKSHNMEYCSSLQPEVVYNFSEIKSTFQVPFLKLRGDCWWLRGMVSICLTRKDKYDWFLHEGVPLDWLTVLLYL